MNRDRPEITDRVVTQLKHMKVRPDIETVLTVVECGSKKPDGCSKHMTHWFRDRNYRGRYFGFNKGLEFARAQRDYDYYWFVVNDIVFSSDQECLNELIACMETEPRMGLIGPGELESNDYKGAEPKVGRRWHKAATVHGLANLIRGEVIHTIGYMNPEFHYSQGASTEYSYRLYSRGWFLAYSDVVSITHDKSGSTYGRVVPITRHEYNRRARNFARKYFVRKYGQDWDSVFSAVLPGDVEEDTYSWHRSVWDQKLKRNWKECYPGFWAFASRIKRLLLNKVG